MKKSWLIAVLLTPVLLLGLSVAYDSYLASNLTTNPTTNLATNLKSESSFALANLSAAAPEEVTILLFGDSGTGEENQLKVARAMFAKCQIEACDFAILLGDNFYSDGVTGLGDPKFQSHFEKPYADFKLLNNFSVFAILGNHDWKGDVDAQIAYTAKSALWVMPAKYYALKELPTWLNITALDTNILTNTSRIFRRFNREYKKNVQRQNQLIRENSCAEGSWNIVVGHNPLFSTGKVENKDEESALREVLLESLQECHVDLYISGHEHFQEHITYGSLNAVIQGAASQLRDRVAPIDFPGANSVFRENQLGFSVLKLSSTRAVLKFYNELGTLIYETQINKNKGE